MVETYRGKPYLRFFQWIFFALAWFGMRPTPFETLASSPLNNWFAFILKGLLRIILGTILLYVASIFTFSYVQNVLLLIGLSLILHFGILNVSTGIWRLLGVDTKELFVAPYKSKSLKEFWGRRWNQAFSEMTALAVYKPLVGKYGKSWAMMISFLFSGLLHEVAISFPVNSGYGLPMLYFVLHALLMFGEPKITLFQKITSHPILSRFWVFGWLLLPLPLLFHQCFNTNLVRPLTGYVVEISTKLVNSTGIFNFLTFP